MTLNLVCCYEYKSHGDLKLNNTVSFFVASCSNRSLLIDDFSSSMQDKDFSQVKPAEELVENPSFIFLQ